MDGSMLVHIFSPITPTAETVIFCIVHVTGKKNWKLYAKKMGSAGTVAFIVMTVLYLLSIKGVVASRWDEFDLGKKWCPRSPAAHYPESPEIHSGSHSKKVQAEGSSAAGILAVSFFTYMELEI